MTERARLIEPAGSLLVQLAYAHSMRRVTLNLLWRSNNP